MSFIKLYWRARKVTRLYKLLYTLNATFDEASAKSYLKSNVKNLDTLNWAETKRLGILLFAEADNKYQQEANSVVAGKKAA